MSPYEKALAKALQNLVDSTEDYISRVKESKGFYVERSMLELSLDEAIEVKEVYDQLRS